MPQPFEATPDQLAADPEPFVDAVYGSLESASLVLPRGPGFVAYPRFNEAYETLKRETRGFRDLREDTVWATLQADSLALVVLRAILGMTPPEWAALASLETGVVVPQNAARSFDQRARTQPDFVANARGVQTIARLRALVRVACAALTAGEPAGEPDTSIGWTRWTPRRACPRSSARPTCTCPMPCCSTSASSAAPSRATSTASPS